MPTTTHCTLRGRHAHPEGEAYQAAEACVTKDKRLKMSRIF